ncbi:N-acetylmuramoyl-L-alanine amidase [Candidatus Dependentiae bacterium]|nr:N-acetylmuramoyl-L-alanine amidase [Candidatus Dependentiae bacterium]
MIFLRIFIIGAVLALHNDASSFFTRMPKKFIIMLDPAGDGKNPGRSIKNSFERGTTLLLADALHQELSFQYPHVRFLFSHKPGQLSEQMQIAQSSNRIGAQLFISIHCFRETNSLPTIALYQTIWNRTTDWWQVAPTQLSLIPAAFAYRGSLKTTHSFMTLLSQTLTKQSEQNTFSFIGGFAIPFRPFFGIQAPAIAIECGLRDEKDIYLLIDPIKNALATLIHKETL